jgi:hypothetical protein
MNDMVRLPVGIRPIFEIVNSRYHRGFEMRFTNLKGARSYLKSKHADKADLGAENQ